MSRFALSEDSTMDDPGEELLARNMVDVHGAEAAIIVRANARGAAVAGRPTQAKSWIRVLGMIQRNQALIAAKLDEDHRNVHFLHR
jgi:hypothetical protein